jgi:Cu(I)/Ag(I) efflux system membrane fusion protein/cobalt-zinc-cadmium efflux system membrane fusion protein
MTDVAGSKLLRVLVALAALAAVAVVAFILGRSGSTTSPPPDAAARAALRYHCPMHPTFVSDKPGDCPICGMRLVPVKESENPRAESAKPGKRVVYQSTMNPSEVSDTPGKDSMGMDLVPVEIDEPLAGAGPRVEGRVPVKVALQKQQLIGVRMGVVQREPLIRTIRTVGRVVPDETRLHHVHTKVGGYIERLYANATGERVRKGQELMTIYSPELLASAQEYLLAVRARERLKGTTLPTIRGSGDDLVESARRRLLLYDVTEEQMRALRESGEAPRTMTLYAEVDGHIIARNVQQGEKIEPGTTVLDIADLSRIWVLADIYEYELPLVSEGQAARMTLSYLPGRSFEGRIALVYPVLSETTRTVKVRLEFANPDLALKPEMFGEVEIRSDLGTRLVVPDSAIIGSGTRDIAFVDLGDGYFEPRDLKLGLRLPDMVEVLEGLTEGEHVVISGNFLIDSESKLKAALQSSSSGRPAGDANKPAGTVHVH